MLAVAKIAITEDPWALPEKDGATIAHRFRAALGFVGNILQSTTGPSPAGRGWSSTLHHRPPPGSAREARLPTLPVRGGYGQPSTVHPCCRILHMTKPHRRSQITDWLASQKDAMLALLAER